MAQKDSFCLQVGERRCAITATMCFTQRKVSLLHFKQMMFGLQRDRVIEGECVYLN